MRVLGLDDLAVLGVHGLRDRDERERRLDVAARLDPAPRDRDGDVLLALEVLVRDLRRHLHLDLGLPVDVVGPLPVEASVLALAGGADVDDHVEVLELEALRDVGVAQLRAHVGVLAHEREDAVHDGSELLRTAELGSHLADLLLLWRVRTPRPAAWPPAACAAWPLPAWRRRRSACAVTPASPSPAHLPARP